MQTHVDRPTAVANALAAAQTDTFEEEHPGPDILKLENTARNRVKREFKRDKMRNFGFSDCTTARSFSRGTRSELLLNASSQPLAVRYVHTAEES